MRVASATLRDARRREDTALPASATRFRGFLPVVVDVETGGFDWNRHALLEIAVAPIDLDENGQLFVGDADQQPRRAGRGHDIDPKSLEITGIILDHPFRDAKPERVALDVVFAPVREAMRKHGCQRAILVGHNAHFDLNFLNAAIARCSHKRSPFHPFSVFDTVTLAGVAYGQTVLSRAVQAAGLEWDSEEAHSAVYDTERTAQLFCKIVNGWPMLNAAHARRSRNPDARPIHDWSDGRARRDRSTRPTADARQSAGANPATASPVSTPPGPPRSVPTLPTRNALSGSSNSTMPRITVPTAPTPTHTA